MDSGGVYYCAKTQCREKMLEHPANHIMLQMVLDADGKPIGQDHKEPALEMQLGARMGCCGFRDEPSDALDSVLDSMIQKIIEQRQQPPQPTRSSTADNLAATDVVPTLPTEPESSLDGKKEADAGVQADILSHNVEFFV